MSSLPLFQRQGLPTLTLLAALVSLAWTPLPVANDPLVRMPGTQPNQVALESPDRCLNCHSDYDMAAHPLAPPGNGWKGSMMAQAARDPLFWACMTVAAQDSIWAVGRPNATDLCMRCHFPEGWLEGRSSTLNVTAMTASDYDGVHCDFCHRNYNPFYEDTHSGVREGSDWSGYWDETNLSDTPSSAAAAATLAVDRAESAAVKLFNATNFFSAFKPFSPNYLENGSGQFFMLNVNNKRASFADHTARHNVDYSRYHKSKYFCSTCHDVSNPVLANLAFNGTPPGAGGPVLTTESDSAYSYYHVERTFSEFMLSDFALPGGAVGEGPFAPGVFETSQPGNRIASCQDCHMRDVPGHGCDKTDSPLRTGVAATTESVEHPKSAVPMHDLTGGNIWVPWLLASTVAGSPNYDAYNAAQLGQVAAVLTLNLAQGVPLDANALLAGVQRAKDNLEDAARISHMGFDEATGGFQFRVVNQTGHKLISGFPEGRRMFLNIKAYNGASLVAEINPYDAAAGTLKGLPGSASSPPLGATESYNHRLVWEMHPESALTGESESFHFALATSRHKDNRIPPRGFRIAEAPSRMIVPAWGGVEDAGYFSAAEYAGGYDQEAVTLPPSTDTIEVRLYYQTTSREYIEFLRDEINGVNPTLSSPTPSGEPSAYVIQTDPFFTQMKAWGNTIWNLWDHNRNVPGAAPYLMTQATYTVFDGGPLIAGDADYSGAVEMDDASDALSVLLNPAACAYPMASASEDAEHSIADVMLIAQHANAARDGTLLSGWPGGPAAMTKVSGDQAASVSTELPIPLVVQLDSTVSAYCARVDGIEVEWEVVGGTCASLRNEASSEEGAEVGAIVTDNLLRQSQPVRITTGATAGPCQIDGAVRFLDADGSPVGESRVTYTLSLPAI